MNRTLIDLLKLNVHDPTANWDLNIGLVLMSYRSAVLASTGFTPYFLLYGREMRLPLDIIYGPAERSTNRFDYAAEVRNTLENAYERARNRLNLAHKRQNNYYDRRTQGTRFKSGNSVWLWSPVLEKGVAPKFQEPWTGPFKVVKNIQDVNYEILDVANKTHKVVHFDRLKKATIKPKQDKLSESELDDSDESDSDDSDFPFYGTTVASKKRTLQKKTQKSPTVVEHKSEAPQPAVAPNETPITTAPQVPAIAPHETPNANIQKPLGTRSSVRANKGVPPLRFNPTVFALMILLILFCSASAHDVILLPAYGAVAEKCGNVSIDESPALLSMVVRMEIPNGKYFTRHCQNGAKNVDDDMIMLEKSLNQPAWMNA